MSWNMTRTTLLCVIAAFATAGCGATTTPRDSTVQTRSSLAAAVATTPIPDGGPDAELKLRGRIDRFNSGHELRLDDKTLLAMATTKISLYEPFQKRRMSFQAIPLRTLVELAGAKPSATRLHAVALDDFVVDLPLGVVTADGAYLAVRNGDGSRIELESGGPIRVVFTDGADDAENYWIWSLATVSFR